MALADNNDGSDGLSTILQPSNLPFHVGVDGVYRPSVPSGIHSRGLALGWLHEGDLLLTMVLVGRLDPSMLLVARVV